MSAEGLSGARAGVWLALANLSALFGGNPWLFVGLVFVLGLIVGSFLNVVIYRLPIMLERDWRDQAEELLPANLVPTVVAESTANRLTLSMPRSACPACSTPISAWQNIPVVSWILLRGRCAACQSPISARYPVVEGATAVLSAWVAWHFGFGAPAACALGVTWALIALTGIDLDHQLLPDQITLPLVWTGLLAAVLIGGADGAILPVAPRAAVIGAATGYLSLWSVYHLYKMATGKEGMGYGDFKLLAALGAWMGWQMLLPVILLSAASGAVLGILMIVLRGRDHTLPMSFGPYLAAAGWLAMLYGNTLIDGYLRVSGLSH